MHRLYKFGSFIFQKGFRPHLQAFPQAQNADWQHRHQNGIFTSFAPSIPSKQVCHCVSNGERPSEDEQTNFSHSWRTKGTKNHGFMDGLQMSTGLAAVLQLPAVYHILEKYMNGQQKKEIPKERFGQGLYNGIMQYFIRAYARNALNQINSSCEVPTTSQSTTKSKLCDELATGKSKQWYYQRALEYVNQNNFVSAFKFFKIAADIGDIRSMYNIGVLYQSGQGVSKDLRQAAHYYEKAANLGHGIAMSNLAVFYIDGVGGLQKDKDFAKSLFHRAARMGVREASAALAYLELQENKASDSGNESDIESSRHPKRSDSTKGLQHSVSSPDVYGLTLGPAFCSSKTTMLQPLPHVLHNDPLPELGMPVMLCT